MPDRTHPDRKSRYDQLLDLISSVSMLIGGIALVALTAMFGWLVFGRYVLNSTPTWVEQAALLLVMLIGFLGAAVGIHRNTHLSISYFREVSPRPLRLAFVVISHLALLGFGAVMMVKSYELAVFKWGTEIPLIHLPEGLRAIPIMLCGAFTSLFSIGHLIRLFKGAGDDGSDG
ncbi:MAG: TRAP transporter small permease [Kiloniellales bacterium]|nr:TRAP transporter small permease [Kiloniellales bacterium]